ncbi:MAG: 1,4-dihydroxy-2-naphthoate polyprenyltransferase [Ignavibacteria bacterium]|jgi:1,4-dihydroxy-2-naphthoate octaprenyltransferase|nr:1,4-dihydroxy-2-naphthoate polyprenyltransferase [Ignavibacteria bacterium]
MIRKNSLKAYILAARPRTLSASATPAIIGSALAYHYQHFRILSAVICLLFALLAQVISNFANDYFDFKKGIDNDERIGPKRAVAEGWIAPKRMLVAIGILLIIAGLLGCSLIYYGGVHLLIVGVLIAIFALAYSGGPYPLSYHGFGDICVFVFFGIVPVGFTYFVQALEWTLPVTLCGAATGLVVINILVANNYRDRETDAKSNKCTSIVLLGERFGRYFYLCNGIVAVVLCQYFLLEEVFLAAVLPLLYLLLHIATWREMVRIGSGAELVVILGKTARNVLIFGLTISIGLLIGEL